ncbi:hypothetical protein Tco_1294169 [Tanacetum coccineum]
MFMATEATILKLELEELSGCAVTMVREDGISVPYQQLCVRTQLSCYIPLLKRMLLNMWNSHIKTVTQDVAYAMDWKTLKKMKTVKYYPRELELMCGRMFHEESEEVEKYVGGLPDLIRGNVMSYQPKMMEKAIEFANDQMDQKVLTIERQAEQKRKLEFNARNNQGHQQQNKRQNTWRAYTAGPGEKREHTRSLPLCTKCNYHHKGLCAPWC